MPETDKNQEPEIRAKDQDEYRTAVSGRHFDPWRRARECVPFVATGLTATRCAFCRGRTAPAVPLENTPQTIAHRFRTKLRVGAFRVWGSAIPSSAAVQCRVVIRETSARTRSFGLLVRESPKRDSAPRGTGLKVPPRQRRSENSSRGYLKSRPSSFTIPSIDLSLRHTRVIAMGAISCRESCFYSSRFH